MNDKKRLFIFVAVGIVIIALIVGLYYGLNKKDKNKIPKMKNSSNLSTDINNEPKNTFQNCEQALDRILKVCRNGYMDKVCDEALDYLNDHDCHQEIKNRASNALFQNIYDSARMYDCSCMYRNDKECQVKYEYAKELCEYILQHDPNHVCTGQVEDLKFWLKSQCPNYRKYVE